MQPLRWRAVDTVNCRSTVRRRTPVVRVTMVVGLLAALLSTAAVANAGATTSTTLPGPAPNQSQINSTQSQVSQIEATLAQEEQQTSILDEKYDTAQQDLQNAQTALQTIATNLVHARARPSTSTSGSWRTTRSRPTCTARRRPGSPPTSPSRQHRIKSATSTRTRSSAISPRTRRRCCSPRRACSPRRPRSSRRRHRPSRRPHRPRRSRRPTSKRPPRRRRP